MTQTAILLTGPEQRPRVVRLLQDGGSLTLQASDGSTDAQVPWWRVFRMPDQGTTHRFGRLDQRHWELRVTSGADKELLSRVGKRPLGRLLYPFRRLQTAKTLIGAVVLIAAVAQHFPAEWTAHALTPRMQHRLVDAVVAQNATKRCSHEGGEAAIRKLLTRLDPKIGSTVAIVGFDVGDFLATAAPANHLIVTRGALQQTDPETMAALFAHQLSHLRHGDPVVALVRYEGNWGVWGALLDGHLKDGVRMNYSGLEERRADVESIAMLRAAHISLAPAARLFEEIRVSRAQGTFVAYEYRDFHFGIDARAKRWARAAAEQRAETAQPALDREDSDALFNFCWAGAISPPQVRPADEPQQPPAPAGQGNATPPTAQQSSKQL